ITTSIVYADYVQGFVVVQAVVMDGEGRVLATAHSEESRGKLPYIKKAETGAIARALALCGYGTQFGEMDEDEAAPQPEGGAQTERPAETKPGKCPECKAVNSHSPTCSRNPNNT